MEPDTFTNLPPVIADHQLLRCIGRGSYGEVWLARNSTGAYRAIKIVYRKSFDHQRPFDREWSGIQKFEPISRSHEGFVDVLHVGIKPDDYFFYVMELGDDETSGQTIDPKNYSPRTLAKGMLAQGKLPFDECLQLGIALSQALAALHKYDLVHRDVKPSNIIFVNGVPKLADIGLVATTAEAQSYVGTEGFIPPEGPGAHSADIYGLGKVLYECSTGKDRHEFPELPTLLYEFEDREKFLELNEIILHACKADASRRYQTAAEMHSDLLLLSNGKSVKRLRFLERRFAAAKRIAGIVLISLLASAAVTYPVLRERRATREALQRQIGADVVYGNMANEVGDAAGALPFYADALSLKKTVAGQTKERLRFALAFDQCARLVQMWFASNSIVTVGFSPDGKKVLVTEANGRPQILDSANDRPPSWEEMPGTAGAWFSPDNTMVIVCAEQVAHVRRADDGSELFALAHPDNVLCAAFSPDGAHIITGSEDGILRLWDVATHQIVQTFTGHVSGIISVTYSHDGRLIATASRDFTARLWNPSSGRQIGSSLEHSSWVYCVAFSPNDRQVATSCFDRKARVWEVATGRQVLPEMRHGDGVHSVQFSPDGRLILTASYDRTVRIWNAADHLPAENSPILHHSDRVLHAAFAPDGHRLITGCDDGTVRIWDLAASSVAAASSYHTCSDDGSRYATLREGMIEVWDVATGLAISPAFRPANPARALLLNADGNFLFVVSDAGSASNPGVSVVLCQASNGMEIAPPFLIEGSSPKLFSSPDGQRLLSLNGMKARIWNTLSGEPQSPWMEVEQSLSSTGFSPDGSKVVLLPGREAKVYDAATGAEIFHTQKMETDVRQARFNRDGSLLAVCCSDGTFSKCAAQVWNIATGQPVGEPLRHNDGINGIAFSPDGTRIATASEDFTAIIWNAKTGAQLTPALKHKDQLMDVAFSPDGKYVATVTRDKTSQIWCAETGEALSPMLRFGFTRPACIRFLGNGQKLFSSDERGMSWVWNLPEENCSVEEMQKLSWLLTSGLVVPAGESRFHLASLKPLWEELRTHQPDHFSVSPAQIQAWHDFQAMQAEAARQWPTAAFHLRRLLIATPGNPILEARLAGIVKHLGEAEHSPALELGEQFVR